MKRNRHADAAITGGVQSGGMKQIAVVQRGIAGLQLDGDRIVWETLTICDYLQLGETHEP